MRLTIECDSCQERWYSNDYLRQNPDIVDICPECFDERNHVVEAVASPSYFQHAVAMGGVDL